MGKPYRFDVDHARKWGVDEAIMLHNLIFWLRKNKAKGKNFHDGHYWTYNTYEKWAKVLPFWTANQIKRIVSSLTTQGVILTSNHNKMKYDRTLWYALTDEKLLDQPEKKTSKSIGENDQMDESKGSDGSGETATPIPDDKPYSNPDGNPDDDNEPSSSGSFQDDGNIPSQEEDSATDAEDIHRDEAIEDEWGKETHFPSIILTPEGAAPLEDEEEEGILITQEIYDRIHEDDPVEHSSSQDDAPVETIWLTEAQQEFLDAFVKLYPQKIRRCDREAVSRYPDWQLSNLIPVLPHWREVHDSSEWYRKNRDLDYSPKVMLERFYGRMLTFIKEEESRKQEEKARAEYEREQEKERQMLEKAKTLCRNADVEGFMKRQGYCSDDGQANGDGNVLSIHLNGLPWGRYNGRVYDGDNEQMQLLLLLLKEMKYKAVKA